MNKKILYVVLISFGTIAMGATIGSLNSEGLNLFGLKTRASGGVTVQCQNQQCSIKDFKVATSPSSYRAAKGHKTYNGTLCFTRGSIPMGQQYAHVNVYGKTSTGAKTPLGVTDIMIQTPYQALCEPGKRGLAVRGITWPFEGDCKDLSFEVVVTNGIRGKETFRSPLALPDEILDTLCTRGPTTRSVDVRATVLIQGDYLSPSERFEITACDMIGGVEQCDATKVARVNWAKEHARMNTFQVRIPGVSLTSSTLSLKIKFVSQAQLPPGMTVTADPCQGRRDVTRPNTCVVTVPTGVSTIEQTFVITKRPQPTTPPAQPTPQPTQTCPFALGVQITEKGNYLTSLRNPSMWKYKPSYNGEWRSLPAGKEYLLTSSLGTSLGTLTRAEGGQFPPFEWALQYDQSEYTLQGNNLRICDFDTNQTHIGTNCVDRAGTGDLTRISNIPIQCGKKVIGGWWFSKIPPTPTPTPSPTPDTRCAFAKNPNCKPTFRVTDGDFDEVVIFRWEPISQSGCPEFYTPGDQHATLKYWFYVQDANGVYMCTKEARGTSKDCEVGTAGGDNDLRLSPFRDDSNFLRGHYYTATFCTHSPDNNPACKNCTQLVFEGRG